MVKNSKYFLNGAKSIFKMVERFKLTVKISNKNTTAPNIKNLEHRFIKLGENFKLPNGNNANKWLPRHDNYEKPLLSCLNRQSRKPGHTKKRRLRVSNAQTQNNILISTMEKNSKSFLNRITIRYTFKSEIIFKSHKNTTASNIKNLEPLGNANCLSRFHDHKKTLLAYLDRQSRKLVTKGRLINNEHARNNLLVSTIGTNFKYFLNSIRFNFKSHKNTTPPNIKNLELCRKPNNWLPRFDNHTKIFLSYLNQQSRKLENTKNKLLEVNNEQTRNNLLISTMGKNSKFFLKGIIPTFKSELIFKSHKNTTAPNIENLETSSKANNWLPWFNSHKTLSSNLNIRHRFTGTGIKDPHLKRPPGPPTVGSVPIDKTLDWFFYKTMVIEGIQLCQALYSDHKNGSLNNIAEFAAGKTGQYFGGVHEGTQSDAHTSKALDWLCYKTIFSDGYQLAQAIYNDHKTGIMNNYAEWDIDMKDQSQYVGDLVDMAQGGAHIGKTLEWFCYITIVIDGIQLGQAIYKDHKNGTVTNTTECAVDKSGQYVGGFVGATVGKTLGSILMPGIGPLVGAFAVGYLGVTYGREIAPKTASYIQNYWIERKLKEKRDNERIRIYFSRPTSNHLVISFKKLH